ncbi:MAG: methionine gamma-lyase [Ignavibacteria bacterium GWA2_55_11]|nr:MAG: methionine gamma-lyase [Ignavibacteria bacterium GWA2_55_11]OGU43490.1 MAG: methionine gamma-lyase [Ignavibacteria bacterium GWC2_56_12]OGU64012.1 MAG: methionine gamma-lyase [Ignavibacteria bacterium RIFCSPHIGHO2_02_FULL_56_12]OGU71904.1 MAG: methionine gamma-lyase [Ignavibacteria bacterium RIFCSPLOWO2_12_FULL_56_21]OGU74672.1 MAG: methionine gamma-lyase [Ignavibacteria bacterium RIFCSPLOWO2_02_FULL_55_14]
MKERREYYKNLKPESLMMSFGYKPEWSEGSVKSPIFQTSTFAFTSAEEGKAHFELAYGKRELGPSEEPGLVYTRINNPDLEILEDRLCLWDGAEACAVFASGMAAIATTLMEFLEPGDLVLFSEPLYGGTDHVLRHFLPKMGVTAVSFMPGHTTEDIRRILRKSGKEKELAMIYIESPANPTNDLIDIGMCVKLAREFSRPDRHVLTAMDNTFLGPVFSHPLQFGIDLVLYSATKYIGGHSDVIAGACLGSTALISRVRKLRSFLGTMAGAHTGWLLMRSLETLKPRMTLQNENAQKIAAWLSGHPKVAKVYYPGLLKESDPQYRIFKEQCLAPGAMISFDVFGGEREAFRLLNSLKMIKLAVSLGSTESLAEHPYSMTHCGVDDAVKKEIGITDKMIRLSVGIEAAEDIIWDLEQALARVETPGSTTISRAETEPLTA